MRTFIHEPHHDDAIAEGSLRPALAAPLELVIFSKDRPAQLELLLRSIKRFAEGWQDLAWSVLYTAGDEALSRGYDLVRGEHPEFRYVDERTHPGRSFKELTLGLFGASPYVAFLVDDDVLRAPLALDGPEFRRFTDDPSIACLSWRMSPRITYCYATDQPSPPPPFGAGRVWNWHGLPGGWGYPMSLDGHVFRTAELRPLVERLGFFSPNSFESALADHPLPAPAMVCLADAPVVNLPVNRVQHTHRNRHTGRHDPEDLNTGFLAGRRLDLDAIAGVENVSTHHEMDLRWEEAGKPGEAAPRDGLDARAFAVVAFAAEAVARPGLLAAWAERFDASDDATLVLYHAGDDAPPAGLAEAAEAAGLTRDGAADVMVLAVPEDDGDEVLRDRAAAVLTDDAPRPRLAWLPHVAPADAGDLRRLAALRAERRAGAAPTAAPPRIPREAARAVVVARGEDGHGPLAERFLDDLEAYVALPGAEALDAADLNPQLHDRTAANPLDPHYFHQDVWAARRIAARGPAEHVDVGSRVDLVGFLTALTEVTFVDIRPLPASIDRLHCVTGSILDLPFADRSVDSLSCLHVAEHIGLGRYGDPLDPQGTRRAAAELQRVLARGGELLFGGPVGRSRVCFNAHRVHDPREIVAWFGELELVELAGVDDLGVYAEERTLDELARCEYGCGLFRFRRPA